VKLVLLAHLAVTLFMVGMIWFVKVVHYPLFAKVGPEGFTLYSKAHSHLTGYAVGPPMLISASACSHPFVSTMSLTTSSETVKAWELQ
jgi:hypothetical protein